MQRIKKTSFYITIIIFFIMTTSAAHSSGFIFKWEPFAVDKDLFFVNQEKKQAIDDMPVSGLKTTAPDDKFIDTYDLSTEKNFTATQKKGEKSFLDNIKIKISPADDTMIDKQKIYTNSDEEQISKFIDAMSTLIYDDKKIKSLETIGKIVEPQIHLYFEF